MSKQVSAQSPDTTGTMNSVKPGQKNAGKDGYEVGYAKPPIATQFKKGRSGNPAGRKRADRIDDLRVLIDQLLAEPVEVRIDGKVREMSALEAMLQSLSMNALKGDPRATRAFFKLAQKSGQFRKAGPESAIVLKEPGNEREKAIIRAFHAEQERQKRADTKH
jgi:Family of unknown function (DUF5681)